MKLFIGTNNSGKAIEIGEILSPLSIDIVKPSDLGIIDAPEEHGDTFEANALEKARFYHERSQLPTLADDSGIIVEALVDELGVHTRRWGAGKDASDKEWIDFFLERMKHETNKRAHFICVLAYIDASGMKHTFEGRCSGVITESLEADYLPGLPISGCFRPDGFDRVYSAMTIDEKNAVSHRGKAAAQLQTFLMQ